ncbi:MAG: ATP-binding cassette domain-containing protein, partial [Clostridia bacterium]|nr:ATP-binding cassette domain-containing protein [Clostridia bacterium]
LDDEKCYEEYSIILDKFLSMDGYNIEDNLSVMLKNLGYLDSVDKKIGELSGGEKIKVLLSELLLSDADIMLLDEPTNNLDYKAIEWLNKYLRDSNKGMIIVSHNEDFLEELVNEIYELSEGKLTKYNMKLSEYFNEKELAYQRGYNEYLGNMNRREEINESLRNLQRINDKHENHKMKDKNKLSFYLHKSHGESKGAGKVKRLEKELETLDVSFREKEKINYKFNYSSDKGKKDINLINLVCGYENFKTKELTLTIPFGSRLNVKGVNGSGKSTLIKTIIGEIKPISGILEVGSDIKFGYISQDSLIKDTGETVYKYLTKDIDKPDEGAIFTILDKFHIPFEERNKPFSVLSPGERTRVNLASLAINQINVLVLDEATNHLDFEAQELLVETLDNFNGTIINISHNSSFTKKLNPTLEINLEK